MNMLNKGVNTEKAAKKYRRFFIPLLKLVKKSTSRTIMKRIIGVMLNSFVNKKNDAHH